MQSVPDGYEALDFVGFTDRGEFSGTETYIENDIVHWNNTAWRCLKDNTTGITPAEGENWTVFIASETDSSGITTTDTEGLVGSAGEKVSNQDLIDAIADRVINRLLSKSAISTTQINDQEKVPSSALVFGMAEEIGELNENISDHKTSADHDSRYYTEDEVNNLMDGKVGFTEVGKTVVLRNGAVIEGGSYSACPLMVQSDTTDKVAGIGFHISGKEAAMLYFSNNNFRYVDNAGNIHVLAQKSHVDSLEAVSSGTGKINSEYLSSGSCSWYKKGKLCQVSMEFVPAKQFTDLCLLFSGLPKAAADQNFSYPAVQADETVKNGLIRIMTNGEIHEFYYFKTAVGKKTKTGFMYITQ